MCWTAQRVVKLGDFLLALVSKKGMINVEMIVFHCTNNECDARFAMDTDTALFAEIHCPGCGGEDLAELVSRLSADSSGLELSG